MRPENADVIYWQVQAQWIGDKKDKKWFYHTYCDIVAGMKFKKAPDDNIPSACGTCWQAYGIHGVLNEESGIKWLELVRRESKLQQEKSEKRIKLWGDRDYIPVRFRLAKIHKTKKTETINI